MQWDGPILTDSGGFQVFSLGRHAPHARRRGGVQLGVRRLAPRVHAGAGDAHPGGARGGRDHGVRPVRPGDAAARGTGGRRRAHHALGRRLQGGPRPPRPAPRGHRAGRDATRRCGGGRPPRSSASASTPTPSVASAWASGATRCSPPSSSWTSCCPPIACATSWASATRSGIIDVISRGVDVFDCVLPTRMARTGTAILRGGGRLNLRNARFATELAPIEEGCDCYTCRTFTRLYFAISSRRRRCSARSC